jgi:hypothetical protein
MTPHQKKFKQASTAARKKCHKSTTTPGAFGKCFGGAMSKALKGTGKKKAKASKAKACAGIVKTGAKKGKLKKGFKFPGGGKCPVKVK